jgi:hypothetical protein
MGSRRDQAAAVVAAVLTLEQVRLVRQTPEAVVVDQEVGNVLSIQIMITPPAAVALALL